MKTEFNLQPGEVIKDITGYEGLFAITSLGRVISYPKRQNGWLLTERKITIDNRGYYRVCIGRDSIKETLKVHRLVAQHFIENPNELPEVNHKDGNKLNNDVSNLEWETRKGNMRHAADNKLLAIKKGSANAASILTESQVKEIHESNLSARQLAKLYPVTEATIYDIRGGRHWKHVTGGKKSKKIRNWKNAS